MRDWTGRACVLVRAALFALAVLSGHPTAAAAQSTVAIARIAFKRGRTPQCFAEVFHQAGDWQLRFQRGF